MTRLVMLSVVALAVGLGVGAIPGCGSSGGNVMGDGGGGGATGGVAGAGSGGRGSGGQGTGGQGSGGQGTGGQGTGGQGTGGQGTGGQGTGGQGTGGQGGAVQPGGGTLPATAIFYQDISKAAVDAESATIMPALAASTAWPGLRIDVAMTILKAADDVPRRTFTSNGDVPDCDTSPVPLPPGGKIEGSDDYACRGAGDCHLLVYQGKRLYEMYQADVTTGLPTGGTFTGGCLVVWDLTRDYWQPATPPKFGRGDHCNGADAADIPIAPLVLTADDVRSGKITHAMRFTIKNANIRKDVYVHPATHIGGPTGGNDQLPYGARLRLRGDYDLTKLPSAEARTVARALQTYGMFLTDGGNLFITATLDVAAAMSTAALRGLKATDFEMVEGGPRYRWRDYQCQRTVVTD
ncbi:MAG TPA: hypothetical protein VFH73_23730 [Polyangia bacterium]|nr:hypothetical protein [Polyangia bacterium]